MRLIPIAIISGLILGLAPYSIANETPNLSEYRYNIFQWVYPEYYFKAEQVSIKKEGMKKEAGHAITFFGLSACIPDEYTEPNQISKNSVTYRTSGKKTGLAISIDDETKLLCSDIAKSREKDFCSSFNSAKEYYHKLFSLTPDSIDETTSTGDMLLIHAKGIFFEHIKKIKIYNGKSFTAYAREFDDHSTPLKQELIIFHKRLPEHKYIVVGFSASDINVETFLKTLSPTI
ncbi:MAG: hypothetical protein KKD44_07315 [Proteobacteria bacterium]|nr:hypothetical protein [Pseudomonadota bacterium]